MLLVLSAAINSNYGMPPSRVFISISCLFLCWAYIVSTCFVHDSVWDPEKLKDLQLSFVACTT